MADTNTERDVNPRSQPAEKTLADFDPPEKPKRNKFALACAILASMTSTLLGYGELLKKKKNRLLDHYTVLS